MKKDLHLKKVYVAVILTALAMLPTAFAIGAFLNNKKTDYKVSESVSTVNQQTEISVEDTSN